MGLVESFTGTLQMMRVFHARCVYKNELVRRGKNEFERHFISETCDYVAGLGDKAEGLTNGRLWEMMTDQDTYYKGWRSPLQIAGKSYSDARLVYAFFRDRVCIEVGAPTVADLIAKASKEYREEKGLRYER